MLASALSFESYNIRVAIISWMSRGVADFAWLRQNFGEFSVTSRLNALCTALADT
jgi:hypothetical protein